MPVSWKKKKENLFHWKWREQTGAIKNEENKPVPLKLRKQTCFINNEESKSVLFKMKQAILCCVFWNIEFENLRYEK